jgi:hypothetical protein
MLIDSIMFIPFFIVLGMSVDEKKRVLEEKK